MILRVKHILSEEAYDFNVLTETIESYPVSIESLKKGSSLKNKSNNVSKDYFHRRLTKHAIHLFKESIR